MLAAGGALWRGWSWRPGCLAIVIPAAHQLQLLPRPVPPQQLAVLVACCPWDSLAPHARRQRLPVLLLLLLQLPAWSSAAQLPGQGCRLHHVQGPAGVQMRVQQQRTGPHRLPPRLLASHRPASQHPPSRQLLRMARLKYKPLQLPDKYHLQ